MVWVESFCHKTRQTLPQRHFRGTSGGPGTHTLPQKHFWGTSGGPGTAPESGPGPPVWMSRSRPGQKRALAPLAGGKGSCQGRRRALAPLAGGKGSRQGRRKALAPLAGGKGCRQGRRRGSTPLAGGKGCRQGRRKALAPVVAIVFVAGWTRSDFRGWTWYTYPASEALLRHIRWTWYGT